MLPKDVNEEQFGKALLGTLQKYGFGTLGKVDIEVALLSALLESSETLENADSYGRAELLRVTDTKYRNLIRRAGAWLTYGSSEADDTKLFQELLKQAISTYAEAPEDREVRILIDDEVRRRNFQRALERISSKHNPISAEISLAGRSLVLKGSDLDRMIDRIDTSSTIDETLKKALRVKNNIERRKLVLRMVKGSSEVILSSLVAAVCQSVRLGL